MADKHNAASEEQPKDTKSLTPAWLKRRIFYRRKRLVRKWAMTREFKNVSIDERFECDLVSLLPNDQEWHYLAVSFEAWVKRNKPGKPTKMAQVAMYKDGELDGQWVMNGSFVQPKKRLSQRLSKTEADDV